MTSGETSEADAEPVARALADWRERRDRGEDVSLDDFCREHPDLADAIRADAAALEVLGRHLRAERERSAVRALQPLRGDRYERFRPAGEGGMGIVYWALDTDLNREVAFKIVRPDSGGGGTGTPAAPTQITPPERETPASAAFETLKARFLQEAWVTAGMSHPGIVPVFELGETAEGVPYYTMRFVRGSRTLAKAIDEAKDKPWDVRVALLEPFLKVCDTVCYAHAQGVVHRDLKPENVALGEFGEVVVLDWGLAKLQDRAGGGDAADDTWRARIEEFRTSADLRTLASALGTPGYMSPEAALGRVNEVDARSDVYSLGAILYRILTGKLPFEFSSYGDLVRKLLEGTPAAPHALDPTVPEALSNLAVRALSKNRDARPASAAALAQEIRDWQARSAADREADALLRDARAGLAAAERLRGADAADALDRATTSVTQAERLRPGDANAATLRTEILARREVAVAERERLARGRTARRAAVAGLAAALVAAATFAFVLDRKRRDVEEARDAAARERDAKTVALTKEEEARARADAEGRRARALGLAHAAAERGTEDPQLALLLARESVRTEPLPQGLTLLHRALTECRERVRVDQRATSLVAARYVAGGASVVTAGGDGSLRICGADGRSSREFAGPHAPASSLDVTRAGDRIACGFFDGAAAIWSATGERIADLPGHVGGVRTVQWSPSTASSTEQQLLTLDGFGRSGAPQSVRARVWNAAGRLLRVIGDDEHPLVAAKFAGADGSVVAGSSDGSVALWDASGARRWIVAASADDAARAKPVSAVAALADGAVAWTHVGRRLRVASADGTLVADVKAHDDVVDDLVPSPDGSRFATLDAHGGVAFWNAAGRILHRVERTQSTATVLDPWTSAAWTPDGSRFLTTSPDGAVHAWTVGDKSAASESADVLRGHHGRVRSLEFAPDGRTLLTASGDGAAIVWSADRAEDLALRCGEGGATSVVWSRDGSMLATAGDGGTFVWKADGVPVAHFPGAASRTVRFSPDRKLVLDTSGAAARVWTLATGGHVDLPGEGGTVDDAMFSPDGAIVLTVPSDGTVRLWTPDGTPRATLRGHKEPVVAACFAPDGKTVATAAHDSTVRRWSVSGELLETHETAARRAISVDIAPDGTLAAGFMDAQMQTWPAGGAAGPPPLTVRGWVRQTTYFPDGRNLLLCDLTDEALVVSADLKRVTRLRGHTGRVVAAAVSSDGSLVATGSEDGTARLWTLDGAETTALPGHTDSVRAVAFSPDGSRLATASADGTVRTWLVATSAALKRADERVTRPFRAGELARYEGLLPDADRRRLAAIRVASDEMSARLLHDDARAAIEARTDLAPDVRAAAVAELPSIGEAASTLNEAAWKSVEKPGAAAADIERAVRLARRAVALRGDVPDFVNTLAVALLRAGRLNDALAAARDAAKRRPAGETSADDELAFALIHAARGASAEAAAALARAKAALESAPPGVGEASDELVREAEAAVSGKR